MLWGSHLPLLSIPMSNPSTSPTPINTPEPPMTNKTATHTLKLPPASHSPAQPDES